MARATGAAARFWVWSERHCGMARLPPDARRPWGRLLLTSSHPSATACFGVAWTCGESILSRATKASGCCRYRGAAAVLSICIAPMRWPARCMLMGEITGPSTAMIALHRKRLPALWSLILAIFACSAGCGPTAAPQPESQGGGTPMAFTLSSSSFAAGATIPVKHTCNGADRSPPLRWGDSPQA